MSTRIRLALTCVLSVTGVVALAAPATATAALSLQLKFSPDPIAPSGTLPLGSTVPVVLTVLSGGKPAPGAVVYLSYATHPINDGGATVPAGSCGGTSRLGSTQTRCTAGSDGKLVVSYRAPTHRYSDGSAMIQAQNQPDHPGVRIRTFYLFSLLYQFSSSPIARSGALTAGATQAVTLKALNAAGTPLSSEPVYLSFRAASGGGTVTLPSGAALSAVPKLFSTDARSVIVLAYRAPAVLPAAGIDTITAQNRATSPARIATDAYAFSAAVPSVSISDVSMVRGDAHPNLPAQFVVTLSRPQTQATTVQYYTSCGIGDKGCKEDILQVLLPKTLTIPAGASNGVITITVYTYPAIETWTEAFFVHLANPTGAALGRALGLGVVLPDRESASGAVVSIGDYTIVKPITGSVAARFLLDMLRPQTTPVVVSFTTSDGTAVAPRDYAAQHGAVTIPVGATAVVVPVAVTAGASISAPLDFTLSITSVSGADATVWRAVGHGQIVTNP